MPLPTRESYAAGHFELAIDGHKSAIYLKSVDGGWARATLVDDPVGSGTYRVKHMSTVDVEPFSFEFGMTGANDVLQWMQGSWNRQFGRRSGQLTHANFNLLPSYQHEFYDALLTEATIPVLDAASKDTGYIKVKVQPERVVTKRLPESGEKVSAPIGVKQKLWSASAFRFNIHGMDSLRYVNKIDSFTIKQGVKKVYTGADRFPQIEPTSVQFPNLTGTISLQYAEELLDWHNKYVVEGKKDHGAQLSGSIEFLSPDRSKTIFSIHLFEVGILFAGIEASTANQDAIKRVKFELYCHRMELDGQGAMGFDRPG